MHREFLNNTCRFVLKRAHESCQQDEAFIRFENRSQVKRFFQNAIEYGANERTILQLAEDVAPRFIPYKRPILPSNIEFLEMLYSEVHSGNINLSLKDSSLKYSHTPLDNKTVDQDNCKNENGLTFDLMEKAKLAMGRLQKLGERLMKPSTFAIDKIFRVPEDLPSNTALIKFNPASVQTHTTGWRDWDDPFEVRIFGAFKSLVAFNMARLLRFDKSALFAAIAGYSSESVKMQYNMTAKSIIGKTWYGSYCLRLNLRNWRKELAWVKFEKSGPETRYMIELQRAERIVHDDKVVFSRSPFLIKPFVVMDDFLVALENQFQPPEHNIYTPVRIN